MELRPGTRLRSAVCATEAIVVKAPNDAVEICCGGPPMLAGDVAPTSATLDQAFANGTLMGKRYVHDDVGLELLCTKPGEGSLAVQGVELPIKDAKALPSSD